jgi:hypothetical protein
VDNTTSNLNHVVFHDPTVTEPRMLGIDFSCALPCSYETQVVDAQTGAVVTRVAGKAVGMQTVAFPTDSFAAGKYQYALRSLRCGKPGTGEARFSRAFAVPLGTQTGPPVLPLPTLPLLPEALFALPTLLPTVPAAG